METYSTVSSQLHVATIGAHVWYSLDYSDYVIHGVQQHLGLLSLWYSLIS